MLFSMRGILAKQSECRVNTTEVSEPAMSLKVCAVSALLLAVLCVNLSWEKPSAVLNRCICRGGIRHINVKNIKALQIIPIPNCPLQLIATLKNNRKLCLNPRLKYLWKNRFFSKSKM